GLVYGGYPLSNIGNATTVQTTGQDAYKNMTDSASTNSLYVSFMVNVTSAQTAGDYFLALLPPTSTTNYTGRFYAKDTTGGVRFGISKSTAAAGGIFYSDIYSLATTYLVVVKYDFNTPSPTDAILSVFVFATGVPPVEPVTPAIGPVTGTANDNTIGRVALRQGTGTNAPVVRVDGIRAASNWSDISTGIQQNTNSVSNNFSLSQNYPNPFNPSTTINFSIPERGFVNLAVYNSLGQIVESLVTSNLNSGSFNYTFNGSNLNSGVYFYKLTYAGQTGNGFTDTKKFILLK
ncbi:MAG: T9SS type A sorting domain-containing protein, partial [bacterium]